MCAKAASIDIAVHGDINPNTLFDDTTFIRALLVFTAVQTADEESGGYPTWEQLLYSTTARAL